MVQHELCGGGTSFGREPKNPKKILKPIAAEKKSGRGQDTSAISDRLLVPTTTLDTATVAPLRYIFEARGIAKKFDDGQVQALRGVNFRVSQGDFLAVTGPSGCGKTTLLQMLGALDRPTKGTLLYRGKSIPDLRDPSSYRALEIGFIFQAFHLLPTFTALENVQIPMFESRLPAFGAERSSRHLAGVGWIGTSPQPFPRQAVWRREATRCHRPESGQ